MIARMSADIIADRSKVLHGLVLNGQFRLRLSWIEALVRRWLEQDLDELQNWATNTTAGLVSNSSAIGWARSRAAVPSRLSLTQMYVGHWLFYE